MFERILVPLDGSPRAEQSIPLAARLAKASGATLLLLQVVNPSMRLGPSSAETVMYLQKVQEAKQVSAIDYLSSLARGLEVDGIKTHILVCSGEPAPLILEVARAQKVDLIVLYDHKQRGFRRWVLGCTSQKVLRQSSVPVLLLRPQNPQLSRAVGQSFRVTVALDGSPFAEAALLPAVHLVTTLNEPGKGELHLLRLVEVPAIEEEPGYVLDPDFAVCYEPLREAGDYLQTVAARLLRELPEGSGLHISWSVEQCKDIADALIQGTEWSRGVRVHKTSQLLALATHGRSGLHRWLLGSVAERIFHDSSLPLLVVHPLASMNVLGMGKEETPQRATRDPDLAQYKEKTYVSAHPRSS